jgi:hypothetical protein
MGDDRGQRYNKAVLVLVVSHMAMMVDFIRHGYR